MSRCKQFVSLLLVMAFLCGFLLTSTVSAAPQELVSENGYTYHVADDGKSVVLTGYTGTETELILPSEIDGKPVFSILQFQADNASEIQKVVVPDSVRIIGTDYIVRSSFEGFTALNELILPDSLFALSYSFNNCPSLKLVRLPHNLHLLGRAFQSCPDIRFEAYPPTFDRLANIFLDRETKLADRIDVIPYPYTTGDLNADNQINTTDARILLQASVGKLSLSEEAAAVSDVNGDGKVDTTDARLVLQYAVGKTDDFAAELLPDFPLIDLNDASITVIQTATPDDSDYQHSQPIRQPVASPDAFLNTWNSLVASTDGGSFEQIKTWHQYAVKIQTETADISLALFTKDMNLIEVYHDGFCFGIAGSKQLLPYLV